MSRRRLGGARPPFIVAKEEWSVRDEAAAFIAIIGRFAGGLKREAEAVGLNAGHEWRKRERREPRRQRRRKQAGAAVRRPPARGEGKVGDDRWAPRVSVTATRGPPISETEGGGAETVRQLGRKAGARGRGRGVGPAGRWASWPATLSSFSFHF